MSGKVWRPETSLADGRPAEPENKEKRRKAKIVRRTTPTVELRGRSGSNANERQGGGTYSTIESSSYNRGSLHLALSHGDKKTAPLSCKRTELCGWVTSGGEERGLQSSSTYSARCAAERSFSSSADGGCRSGLQSRASSRASGSRRRNVCYEFKHLPGPQAYIDDYLARCCFSALDLSRQECGTDALREACERLEEDIKARKDISTVVSVARRRAEGGKDQYLQQLASRLGVSVMQSINEKQLRYKPQPSFTKRSRVAEDLVVSTQEEKSSPQEQDCIPLHEGQSPNEPELPPMFTGLELPKIMASLRAKKDKTLSTSSVTKYLTINSRTHPRVSLGLGEEESAVDTSSQGSVGEPAPDPPDPHPAREKPATKTVVEVSSISGKERGEGSIS